MPRSTENSLCRDSGCSHLCSLTSRAELIFTVSLVEQHLRELSRAWSLSNKVPIFLAAILESLTCRLLEISGNEAQHIRTQRCITPELLDLAVYSNMELSDMFQFITISQVAPAHH
ncbi:histone H2A-Bbd type 2/3-like [Mus caroli]|uniref:Histone H2A n=1 Tax=Mus caroli TaxID=10089 RepID=A0A6P5NXQ8_MUSCR|nr:histone H2A-Bbd type 2/3-like [Mus caroli]